MKKLMRLFPVLLVAVLLLSTASAVGNTADFAGGTGTEADPYLISNKTELNNVRNHLDAYFKMTADIVFTDEDFAEGGAFYNGGDGWAPIGTDYSTSFTGTFNGNGKTITGLFVNTAATYGGLFGYTSGATIRNLGMVDSDITVTTTNSFSVYAGGIAGCAASSDFTNCYNTGTVSSGFMAGGITGSVSGNSDIIGCYNTGDVSAFRPASGYPPRVGGIVGNSGSATLTITNCYNMGVVSGDSYVAGIIGQAYGGATSISSCYNVGMVTSTSSYMAGGIASEVDAGTTITNCCYLNTAEKGVWRGTDTTTKCTAAEMQTQNTFAGFDFDDVWTMTGNEDYPYPELVGVAMEYEKALVSIAVTTKPTKLTYKAGETLDVSGGVVTCYYTGGIAETVNLTAGMVSGFDNSTLGEQTVTVTYEGKTATFSVSVLPDLPTVEDFIDEWGLEGEWSFYAYSFADGSWYTEIPNNFFTFTDNTLTHTNGGVVVGTWALTVTGENTLHLSGNTEVDWTLEFNEAGNLLIAESPSNLIFYCRFKLPTVEEFIDECGLWGKWQIYAWDLTIGGMYTEVPSDFFTFTDNTVTYTSGGAVVGTWSLTVTGKNALHLDGTIPTNWTVAYDPVSGNLIITDPANYIVYYCRPISVGDLIVGTRVSASATYTYSGQTVERHYYYYIPSTYQVGDKLPVVISLHGSGENARMQLNEGKWLELAEEEGFIVIAPEAVGIHADGSLSAEGKSPTELGYAFHDSSRVRWHVFASDPQAAYQVDDVQYLCDLIDLFVDKGCADADRVYSTGLSHGAFMSIRLAVEAPEKIAGIGSVAGLLAGELVERISDTPVKLVFINGTNDGIVPHTGMVYGDWVYAHSLEDSINHLLDGYGFTIDHIDETNLEDVDPNDGCTITRYEYVTGDGYSPVVTYLVENGGHTWPGGTQYMSEASVGRLCNDAQASQLIWEELKDVSRAEIPGGEGGEEPEPELPTIEEFIDEWGLEGKWQIYAWDLSTGGMYTEVPNDFYIFTDTTVTYTTNGADVGTWDLAVTGTNSLRLTGSNTANWTLEFNQDGDLVITEPRPAKGYTIVFYCRPATGYTEITDAQTIEIAKPVKNGVPQTTIADNAKYSGTIIWSGSPVKFAASTEYTATVTLTAKSGYKFTDAATATVAGAESVTEKSVAADGSTMTFKANFEATGAKELIGIAVTTKPSDLTYTHGETLNTAGMVVTATYDDSSTEDVTASATVTYNEGAFLKKGDTSVTVSWGGKTAALTGLTVEAKELTITGLTATDRAYNGNTSVALSGGTLNGKVAGDDVNVAMPTVGTVTSADAGNGKAVSVAKPALIGDDAGCYVLADITGVTVNISAASISPSVAIEGWTYGEVAKAPVLSGNTYGGAVVYEYKLAAEGDGAYTTDVPEDAGDYTVRASVGATANSTANSCTANFTIARKTVTNGMIQAITGQIYTGSAIEPVIAVKDGNSSLVPGTDYTVSYSANINVGTATVTITGAGNYTDTASKTFAIIAKTITEADFTTLGVATKTYSGSTQTQTIESALTLGTDYSVVYESNTNVGTAKYTITGKGNYTGSFEKTFAITAKTITEGDFTTLGVATKTYSGSTQTQTIESALTLGTDYSVVYESNTNVGTAKYTITGKGNYTGSFEKTFAISPAEYTVTVTGAQDIKFGSGLDKITVANGVIGVGVNGEALSGTFAWYTDVECTDEAQDSDINGVAVDATKTLYWKFTPAANSNYNTAAKTGSVVFTVIASDPQTLTFIPNAVTKIYGDANFTTTATNDRNDGGAITYTSSNPEVATVNATTGEVTILKKGTTTITATAAAVPGVYTAGTASYTLTVNAKSVTNAMIQEIASQTYTGSAIEPVITVKDGNNSLAITTDYTVSYAENTNVGTATVTITGAGNYIGTASKTFVITAKTITEADFTTLGVEERTYNGSAQTQTITSALTHGIDYTEAYENNTYAGVASYTITGKGNYTGTVTKNFNIIAAEYNLSGVPTTMSVGDSYTPSTIKNAVERAGNVTIDSIVVYKADGTTPETNPQKAARTATFDATTDTVTIRGGGKIQITYSIAANNVDGSGLDEYNAKTSQTVTVSISAPSAPPIIVPPVPTPAPDPEGEKVNPFTDIEAGDYYYEAVLWAYEQGITNGSSSTTFSPADNCTRAQMATFLWRAAGCPEPSTKTSPFTDIEEGDYYYKAVLWAYEQGITNGSSSTTFSPADNCTRAQMATFLWRAAGRPGLAPLAPFTDVEEDEYYYKAVLWAYGEDITNGTSSTTFSPADNCTRAQMVTFLWRAYGK